VSLLRYWKGDSLGNGVDYIAKSLAYQLPVPVNEPLMPESTYEPIEPVDNLTEFFSELESADEFTSVEYNSSISYDMTIDVPSVMTFKSDIIGGGGSTLLKTTSMLHYNATATESSYMYPPSSSIAIFNPLDSLSRVLGAIFTLGRYSMYGTVYFSSYLHHHGITTIHHAIYCYPYNVDESLITIILIMVTVTATSGCSLGPEGPSVELGVSISRVLSGQQSTLRERHHLFLAGTGKQRSMFMCDGVVTAQG